MFFRAARRPEALEAGGGKDAKYEMARRGPAIAARGARMVADYRVSVDFYDHPKTLELEVLAGELAVAAVAGVEREEVTRLLVVQRVGADPRRVEAVNPR